MWTIGKEVGCLEKAVGQNQILSPWQTSSIKNGCLLPVEFAVKQPSNWVSMAVSEPLLFFSANLPD